MNKFEESENKGRTLLKEFLDQVGATEQQPTTDKFDPVDYYFTYKGNKVVAEIKVRDVQYKNYDTHIIEDNKLKALLKAKEDNECDFAYYINFFGEDVVYWYSTGSIINSATPDIIACNRTTAVDTGKKDKDVWMIPNTVAQIYVKKDGIWCKK